MYQVRTVRRNSLGEIKSIAIWFIVGNIVPNITPSYTSVESVTLRLPVIVTSSVVAASIGAEIVMAIADDGAPGSLKSFESSFFRSPP